MSKIVNLDVLKNLGLVPAEKIFYAEDFTAAGARVVPETKKNGAFGPKVLTGRSVVTFGDHEMVINFPVQINWHFLSVWGDIAYFGLHSSNKEFGAKEDLAIAALFGFDRTQEVRLPFQTQRLPVPSWVSAAPHDDFYAETFSYVLQREDAKAAVLDYIQQIVTDGVVSAEEIVAALQAATA